MNSFYTVEEAAKVARLAQVTIKAECRKGSFVADKPRGRRGGWEIDAQSLHDWLIRRKLKTDPMREYGCGWCWGEMILRFGQIRTDRLRESA